MYLYLHISSYILISLIFISSLSLSLHISSYIFIYLHISSYIFIYLHISSNIFIYLHLSFIFISIFPCLVISSHIFTYFQTPFCIASSSLLSLLFSFFLSFSLLGRFEGAKLDPLISGISALGPALSRRNDCHQSDKDRSLKMAKMVQAVKCQLKNHSNNLKEIQAIIPLNSLSLFLSFTFIKSPSSSSAIAGAMVEWMAFGPDAVPLPLGPERFFFSRAPFGPGGLVAECIEPGWVYHVTTRALDQGGVEPRLAVSLRSEGHRQYHYTTAPAPLGPERKLWQTELMQQPGMLAERCSQQN